MNIVLLQSALTVQEIEQLIEEFPHFLFLSFTHATYKNLSKEDWAKVEILYGNRLTEYEFSLAHQLRWIHSPTDQLNRLCLDLIEKQGKVQITIGKEENLVQLGEYMFAGILAFAKNLFQWKEMMQSPATIWDSQWRDRMWSLQGKKFLQVGLGNVGTELARRARQFGMTVWGMQPRASFNPHCQKTFALEEFQRILPEVDIVSICLPKSPAFEEWFGVEELNLMKNEAILAVVGSYKIFVENVLVSMKHTQKLRGLLLDASYQAPIPQGSLLWTLPNALITPEVGARPKAKSTQSYRTFRYNLRQYVHGNSNAMTNRIDQNRMLWDF
ncbi:MAG: D-2-hydroxyacid dehydrogenase [Parachlamydia sp.]|nr:MAG: D-2-hydroxyacid dehydrogenase [Parachlamydia sp.]